jgi:uncharacterized membrane protein
MLAQSASIVGAVLILVAYAAHQTGRLGRESTAYHLINALGGVLLLAVAINAVQIGFIVLESVWIAISLWALRRLWARKDPGSAPGSARGDGGPAGL